MGSKDRLLIAIVYYFCSHNHDLVVIYPDRRGPFKNYNYVLSQSKGHRMRWCRS